MHEHLLEPAAQAFVDAWSKRPTARAMGVEGARAALEAVQTVAVTHADVTEEWITVACDHGDVRVRISRPAGIGGPLPVVLYLHGGGWVQGSAATHDRLVRELAVGAGAAVAFVEYDRSPEAQYPVAVEQAYAAARWITREGVTAGLDRARLAVAGDSAGGNLAAAVAILALRRDDVTFCHQSLYHPVTDATLDTDCHREFAEDPYRPADAMAWFWDCYLPEVALRGEVTASPLRADVAELVGLPTTLIIVAECDVLRDEGEAYARKLVQAGIRTTVVRFNGIMGDFMVLDPVRETAATDAAVGLAIDTFRKVFAQ